MKVGENDIRDVGSIADLVLVFLVQLVAGPLETGSTPVEESTLDVLYALRCSGHKVHRSWETPGACDSAEAVTSKYAQEASRTLTTASSVAYLRRPVPEARTLRKDVLLPSSRTQ